MCKGRKYEKYSIVVEYLNGDKEEINMMGIRTDDYRNMLNRYHSIKNRFLYKNLGGKYYEIFNRGRKNRCL